MTTSLVKLRYVSKRRLVAFGVLLMLGSRVSDNAAHDCFVTATEVEKVVGRFEEKFSPVTGPGKAFDAREAEFLNHRVKWGMIAIEGSSVDTGMCWVGGYVYTNKPWNASWEEHKALKGPTRNSAAISIIAREMTVAGLHYFNVHDGVRISNAFDALIAHNWGEYVRDDCIENDHLRSGRIYDSLFDGCYTGISTRPSSSDRFSSGEGQIVELDRVLLRLQAMPYPFDWERKKGVINANGDPYDLYNDSSIPYGHGSFFKLTDVDRNPHFSIKNSVFLATHLTEPSKFDFPRESLIDVCENNIVIWLGPGPYPGKLPARKFPDGIKIVTGQEGRDLWRQKVVDWHARHPDVDTGRKPASPGSLVFPQKF